MSGDAEQSVSGWTVDTLKEFLQTVLHEADRRYEQRFSDQKEAVTAALVAAKEAVTLSEANAEKWRASANEWRGAMSDRERTFLTRVEYDRAHTDLAARLEAATKTLEAQLAALQSQLSSVQAVVQ